MKTRCVPLVSQDLHAMNMMADCLCDACWLFSGKDETPKDPRPPSRALLLSQRTHAAIIRFPSKSLVGVPCCACASVFVCLCLFIESEQVGQASCFGFVFVEDSCYMTWLESSRGATVGNAHTGWFTADVQREGGDIVLSMTKGFQQICLANAVVVHVRRRPHWDMILVFIHFIV